MVESQQILLCFFPFFQCYSRALRRALDSPDLYPWKIPGCLFTVCKPWIPRGGAVEFGCVVIVLYGEKSMENKARSSSN